MVCSFARFDASFCTVYVVYVQNTLGLVKVDGEKLSLG